MRTFIITLINGQEYEFEADKIDRLDADRTAVPMLYLKRNGEKIAGFVLANIAGWYIAEK